jgi:hypothetical protein
MSTFTSEFSDFLQTCIHSASELSVLLQLARDERREWTALETAVAVRCDPHRAERALEALVERGLAARIGAAPSAHYRYEPRSPRLRLHVAWLDQIERQQPVSLIRAIYGLPIDNTGVPFASTQQESHD